MKRLDKVITLRGVGKPDIIATQLQRTNNVCLYERSDEVWEVWKPTIIPKGKVIFDTVYDDDTEMPPVNEDFGYIALCIADKKQALKRYNDWVQQFG